jgi:hypothetical protein
VRAATSRSTFLLGRISGLLYASDARTARTKRRRAQPCPAQVRPMKPAVAQFSLALRLVHWLTVVLLITMLFMVIVMVSVAETRTWRIGLHRRLAS